MKKLSLLLALIWVSCYPIIGQAVTTDPLLPTGDKEVTLIFDLKQSKDSRTKGLLGKTSDVYLWSGAGTTATGNAFEYVPTGQSNFAEPFTNGKMTSLGNDVWSIKITPRTFYNVPTSKSIKRLGVLLKNGNGTAQTEDFFVTMYDAAFSLAFLSPTESSVVLKSGQDLAISLKSSAKALYSAEISVGSTLITNTILNFSTDSTDTFATTIPYNSLAKLINDKSSTITMKVQAKAKLGTATAQLAVLVPPQITTAEVPAGWKDGINYLSETSVGLVLYAPNKDFVHVIGDFNSWETNNNYLLKRNTSAERYWIQLDGIEKGKEYAFQYLINGTLAVADPYAEKILDPNNDQYIPSTTYPNLKTLPSTVKTIASVFQTGQTAYAWKNTTFKRPAKEDLVVYELHVRDFVANKNYQAVIDTLSYLKKLGVNAIELMPVQEFTGNDSWGYNPIFYFAPDKAYGTKDDLKRFIDKCHELGIAVLMDMVFNQADYEFPYVKMYWDGSKPSADSPMFNQTDRHPFGVFFDFNHESVATKAYVNRANAFWLQEYKIDGFRFDLAKGFTQKQTSNDAQFRLYDQSRVDIWKGYYDNIRKVDASAFVILELFSEDLEERTFTNMGMMVWGNHNYDFRGMMKGESVDLTRLSYQSRGMTTPGVVSYMESHDEERLIYDAVQNGKTANSYSTRDLATALEREKANVAVFMAVPGPKMIWQFGELGYDVNIDFNGRTGQKPLKWEYLTDARRLKLYKAYAAMVQLKTSQAIFKTTDFSIDLTGMQKKVTLRSSDNTVLVVGNFDIQTKGMTRLFPSTGKWYDYFTGSSIDVGDLDLPLFLEPGEFHIFSTKPFPKPEADIVPWKVPSALVITGIEEEAMAVKLFPNPATNMVRLSVPTFRKGDTHYEMYDFYGKMVKQGKIEDTNTDISIADLKEGLYLIHIQDAQRNQVLKMIKQ
ncbi:DUF4961 domain-containing protein [Flectobacillus roseus]